MAAQVCAAATECASILVSDRLLGRHQGRATPALLKAAFDQLAANAAPAPLRDILQFVEHFQRTSLIGRVQNPDFRQTLINRNFSGDARQELPLDAASNASALELIGPERRKRQVGRLDLEGLGQGVLDQLRQ